MAEERKRGEHESHMANKQMGRHLDRAFGGKETPAEERAEGHHESFHVFKHAGGVHSVHHHAGGIDHADHADHHEAMEHGKMAMGGEDGEEAMHAGPAPMGSAGAADEQWG